MSNQDFIKKQTALYKSLTPCFCPAIQESVHFTADGLNHLFFHRRRPRNLNERAYRAALIPYIVEVLQNAKVATRISDPMQYGPYPLWIMEHEVSAKYKGKRQIIKVVLQKKGAGNTHFLSVMCQEKD